MVNVFWWAAYSTAFLAGLVGLDVPGVTELLVIIWLACIVALARMTRMGMVSGADGVVAHRLFGSVRIPAGAPITLRIDRVGKEQLVAQVGRRTVALPHMVHVGRSLVASPLGIYPRADWISARPVGDADGGWERQPWIWGEPQVAALFGEPSDAPGGRPRPALTGPQVAAVSFGLIAGMSSLVVYSVTGALAWLALAVLLVGGAAAAVWLGTPRG